jgi:RND superfamily putative drug exporter
VSDRDSHPSTGVPGALWRRLGRAIVWLRYLILPAWIAGLVLATTHLPSAFESESELGSLLPRSSQALKVERKAADTFGLPILSRTMVVAREPQGFSPSQAAAAGRYVAAADRPQAKAGLRAVPLIDAPGLLGARRGGTTLVVYLYLDPALSESEQQDAAEQFASGLKRESGISSAEVTGALPATRAETNIVNSHIIWVELATVLLVVGILAFYFRSVGVPLLGLASVAIAYLCADHVLGWVAERFGISIPREAEPVIVALIFGTLTDYLVFFVSGYRQRLRDGLPSRQAVSETAAELLPVILTAALMIAGATLTLLLSGVHFLSAFGPAMAVAVVVAAAVSLTLVPAALGIFGRALLWPRAPIESDGPAQVEARPEAGARGHLIGFAVRFPLLVCVVCLIAFGAAATGLRELALGNPIIRGLPESSSAHRGYEDASTGLGPGVLGPTMLVIEGEGVADRSAGLESLRTAIAEQDGVAGVLAPSDAPLGQRPGVLLAPGGDAARYVVVLDGDPDGAAALRSLDRLEEKLPALLARAGLGDAKAAVTGDTSIASELADDTWTALERVAPAALAVLLLLLWILLRSRSAPLYLVGVSVLVVAASLGLTVYVFQDLLGYGEIAFFVPVASAILLLALGADYNVFLVSRIWNESEQEELRPAIRAAGSRAGAAITVAGLMLALSFAAVALIPIQSFRELAFALSVGLLLDTLIARTLLIPALVRLFGRGASEESRGTSEEALSSPQMGSQ